MTTTSDSPVSPTDMTAFVNDLSADEFKSIKLAVSRRQEAEQNAQLQKNWHGVDRIKVGDQVKMLRSGRAVRVGDVGKVVKVGRTRYHIAFNSGAVTPVWTVPMSWVAKV